MDASSTQICIEVLKRLFEIAKQPVPDLSGISLRNENILKTGIIFEFEKSDALRLNGRENIFPERVFGEIYGISDTQPVGFLVYFDGEYIDAIEGYAILETFPESPKDFNLVSKQEAENALKTPKV